MPFLFKKLEIEDVVLIEPNSNFPVGGQSDSAILFIPSVDGLNIYGDRTTPQLLKIDKLESVINSSNVYYQNNKFDIDENYTTYFTGSLQENGIGIND